MAEVSSFTLHNAQGSCGCFFATLLLLLLLLQVVAIVKCCSSFISVAVIVVAFFGHCAPVAVKLQLLLNKCHITCA